MSTGHLHLSGFKSLLLTKHKRHPYGCLLLLVRATGLEPARFWQWNLRVIHTIEGHGSKLLAKLGTLDMVGTNDLFF